MHLPVQSLQGLGGVGMEKQLLPSVMGDGTSAVTEPGLVAGGHCLGVFSFITWPGRAQGSWSRLQPKQMALL